MSDFEGFGETDEDVTARSAATPESLDATKGIEYVDDAGRPEEAESLPPLMTAADLLADDPLADIPVEAADEETPPDPTPITDKRYGPRGTPKRDAWDALQRERGAVADAQIAADPRVQRATEQEAVRLKQKAAVQEAFVKAQREKAKKS